MGKMFYETTWPSQSNPYSKINQSFFHWQYKFDWTQIVHGTGFFYLLQSSLFHIDQKLKMATITGKFEKIFTAMEISKTKNMIEFNHYISDN